VESSQVGVQSRWINTQAEQPDESALEEHGPIRAELAILNVSIDQAAHCTDSGQQFADQVVTLS
jgi:hypothetical protein